jgi:hypothetical protein
MNDLQIHHESRPADRSEVECSSSERSIDDSPTSSNMRDGSIDYLKVAEE